MTQPALTGPHPAHVSSTAGATPEQQRAQRFGSLGGIGREFDATEAQQRSSGSTPSVRTAAGQQDPRDVRVDAICDRILAELRTSPDAVKDIFIKPDETIAALRATSRNLTRRDRDLRRFLSPQDDERLMREREALQKRVAGESDEVTRMRLASALAALEAQREQRQELARAATRFDAEHTRISYTLESLYTQVVRMRSADSSSVDVAGAGLPRRPDKRSHEGDARAAARPPGASGGARRPPK